MIINGGTILHTKWLAFGFLYRAEEDIKFQVLDVNVLEKATAKLINDYIDNVVSKIINDYKSKVVACCTDNAYNFKKCSCKMKEMMKISFFWTL